MTKGEKGATGAVIGGICGYAVGALTQQWPLAPSIYLPNGDSCGSYQNQNGGQDAELCRRLESEREQKAALIGAAIGALFVGAVSYYERGIWKR